jgi:hypothetical protein
MIKRYCDACGKDITNNRVCQLSYLVHLDRDQRCRCTGYVDSDGNSISGRSVSYDLCIYCYNKCMIKAVEEFENIKELNN